jgi:hypothetical protein
LIVTGKGRLGIRQGFLIVDACSLATELAAEWWWWRKKNLANKRKHQGESISGIAIQQAGATKVVKRARTPVK